jgi:hypothetical protein
MNNARVIGVLLIIGVSVLFTWYMNAEMEEMDRRIEEEFRGAETEEEFIARLEAEWIAAFETLEAGDVRAAEMHYREVSGARNRLERDWPDALQSEGMNALAWSDEQEENFQAMVRQMFDLWVDELRKGKVEKYRIQELFHGLGVQGLQQEFRDLEAGIRTDRAQLASRWVRVTFDGLKKDYRTVLTDALRARFSVESGYNLVFGRPMSGEEEDATFRHLRVKVRYQDVEYVAESGPRKGQVVATVPIGVTLEFEMAGRETVETTWDSLAPLAEIRDFPESVTADQQSGYSSEAEALKEENRKALLYAVAVHVDTVPQFATK